MYGMINEAMRRLVTEKSGELVWSRIAARANTPEHFAMLHYYDDAVTYDLLMAASLELEASSADLLRDFGHYWSTRVGPENYRDILGAAGTDVVSVLTNLDEMHSRIQALYPDLRPPSFEVHDVGLSDIEVHYRSERAGLAPFVIGLLEGLGDLYGTPAVVTHTLHKSETQRYDVFHVNLGT